MTSTPTPRRFYLHRTEDPTGVSGTGYVADGVLWPDGTANIRWRGEHPSAVFWDHGQASVELIHGHGGATRIVWLDTEPDTELNDALAAAAHTVLEGAGPRTTSEWAALVADAVLPVVRSRLASAEQEAEKESDHLRGVLAEVLAAFRFDTHPGEPCKQSGHVSVRAFERWREALRPAAAPEGSGQ